MNLEYPCPDCRTTNNLHEPGCSHDGVDIIDIEAVYLDLLSELSTGSCTIQDLKSSSSFEWDETLHGSVLGYLQQSYRVAETDAGALRLVPPDEYLEEVSEPRHEPIKTVYEQGSVPGCHDNAVFALVAFFEMVGLSWDETRSRVLEWFEETGTWERGGFAESSPEEVVDSKKHVYDQGYGWKEKATAAKTVIDRR